VIFARLPHATSAILFGVAATVTLSPPAAATVINTLPGGTAQPIPSGQRFVNRPTVFADNVTYHATTLAGVATSSNFGGSTPYSFAGSGSWSGTPMVAIGLQTAIMSFTFADPVSAALAEFNWARSSSSPDLVFRAYNAAGTLLETLTFDSQDPTRLTGFYGFQRATNDIARFEVQGYWVGARNLSTLKADIAAVPEPASWAMMIAGFGLIGTAARRTRRHSLAAAI
jgi:hypothetical protein